MCPWSHEGFSQASSRIEPILSFLFRRNVSSNHSHGAFADLRLLVPQFHSPEFNYLIEPMSGSTETAVLAAALIATASGPAVAETIRRRASSFSVTASDAAKAAKAALMGENKETVKLAPAPSQTAAADDAEFAAVDALRAAIPAHCWTKDTVRSIGYLLQVRNR